MKNHVLFVDDELGVTKAMERALCSQNYSVITANSAKEALEILAARKIQVVVSDEKMPHMTGAEFLAIVRQKYPETVRIMLTGQASLGAAVSAINDGEIYRFLMKPCDTDELELTIRTALGKTG